MFTWGNKVIYRVITWTSTRPVRGFDILSTLWPENTGVGVTDPRERRGTA